MWSITFCLLFSFPVFFSLFCLLTYTSRKYFISLRHKIAGSGHFHFPSHAKFTSIIGYTSCRPTYIESFMTIFGQCINIYYYMASSASGQEEGNPVFWLATRTGTMGRSGLPAWDCPLCSRNLSVIFLYSPRFFFFFWRFCGPRRRLGPQKRRKRTANIQPSWPHVWSITYIPVMFV